MYKPKAEHNKNVFIVSAKSSKLTLNNILEVVNFIINFDGRIREITLENK